MTSTTHKAMTISQRRAGYPLHQRIKVYDPDSMAKRLNQEKTQGKMIVNGINILNKASLDTDIIMDRIKHRRETHNRVERRRRDMLNTLINELAQSMPETATMEPEKCHRALVLRQAISYIRTIQSENNALRAQLSRSTSSSSSSSSLSSTSNTLCTPTNDTTTTTTSTATTTLDTKAQNQNL